MTTEFESRLVEIRERIVALKKQAQAEASALFAEVSAQLFVEHPTLLSFAFQGYAPHFNDSDPCTFSAHTDQLNVVFMGVNGDVEFNNLDSWSFRDKGPGEDEDGDPLIKEQAVAVRDIFNFLGKFDDGDFENMFGSDFTVTVTSKGTDIDDAGYHD